jgi:short-subunit dehydrogenase
VTAIVVGASSGLGRALATELARHQHPLLLVASDLRDVDALAADLHLRHGVAVRALALDLGREAAPGERIIDALAGLPDARVLLLPIGMSRNDDDFSLDAAAIGQLIAINLHAPTAIVHALLPALTGVHGTVVGFGSIAAVRGRGNNVAYAAAKRGLESLFESLRQRHRPRELRVQFYRLGFLKSNLTFGENLPLPAANPDTVARTVVERLTRGSGTWFLPRWWALVALALEWVPWPIYRRLRQ